ncbi:MAG: hypothetical protein HYV02_07275 [Deltaproteobacteria bacterium]|nr:hypothetical protein [Deltaproteobacteria bacterium]
MNVRQLVSDHASLREYFRTEVNTAAERLQVQLADHAEFYLVNLLDEFRRTEQLFELVGETLEDVPLAVLLERAVHGDHLPTKIRSLRQLGDRALFVAGYFPERTNRVVNRDYFIQMGSGAYQSLATLFHVRDAFAEVYTELGGKFPDCVLLIDEVQRAGRGENNRDLLRYYETWLATGCERLAHILQKAGIPLSERKPSSQ